MQQNILGGHEIFVKMIKNAGAGCQLKKKNKKKKNEMDKL